MSNGQLFDLSWVRNQQRTNPKYHPNPKPRVKDCIDSAQSILRGSPETPDWWYASTLTPGQLILAATLIRLPIGPEDQEAGRSACRIVALDLPGVEDEVLLDVTEEIWARYSYPADGDCYRFLWTIRTYVDFRPTLYELKNMVCAADTLRAELKNLLPQTSKPPRPIPRKLTFEQRIARVVALEHQIAIRAQIEAVPNPPATSAKSSFG
jgi:hypothetical protein